MEGRMDPLRLSRKGKSIDGSGHALSRPVNTTRPIYGHITALLGAGLPSHDRVALPVVAQLYS